MGAHVSLYLGPARVPVRPHFCGRRRKEHAQHQRARSVPALGVRPGDYLLRVLELALDEIFDSFVEENSKQLSYIYAGERARADRIGRVSLCGKRFQCDDTQHESKNEEKEWKRRRRAFLLSLFLFDARVLLGRGESSRSPPERYDDDDDVSSVSVSFVFSFVLLVR